MLKRILILPGIILIIAATIVVAAPNQWKLIETDDYSLEIPGNWDAEKGREMPGPDFTFELKGAMIPEAYNGQPTSASGYIRGVRGATLDEGIRNVIAMNRSNADKYFPSDSDQVTHFKLASGEDAAMIKTRWTRMAKDLQQTKYDLVVYSKKKGYVHNVSIYFAYYDKKYELEADQQLDERIGLVLRSFKLKA